MKLFTDILNSFLYDEAIGNIGAGGFKQEKDIRIEKTRSGRTLQKGESKNVIGTTSGENLTIQTNPKGKLLHTNRNYKVKTSKKDKGFEGLGTVEYTQVSSKLQEIVGGISRSVTKDFFCIKITAGNWVGVKDTPMDIKELATDYNRKIKALGMTGNVVGDQSEIDKLKKEYQSLVSDYRKKVRAWVQNAVKDPLIAGKSPQGCTIQTTDLRMGGREELFAFANKKIVKNFISEYYKITVPNDSFTAMYSGEAKRQNKKEIQKPFQFKKRDGSKGYNLFFRKKGGFFEIFKMTDNDYEREKDSNGIVDSISKSKKYETITVPFFHNSLVVCNSASIDSGFTKDAKTSVLGNINYKNNLTSSGKGTDPTEPETHGSSMGYGLFFDSSYSTQAIKDIVKEINDKLEDKAKTVLKYKRNFTIKFELLGIKNASLNDFETMKSDLASKNGGSKMSPNVLNLIQKQIREYQVKINFSTTPTSGKGWLNVKKEFSNVVKTIIQQEFSEAFTVYLNYGNKANQIINNTSKTIQAMYTDLMKKQSSGKTSLSVIRGGGTGGSQTTSSPAPAKKVAKKGGSVGSGSAKSTSTKITDPNQVSESWDILVEDSLESYLEEL